MKRNTPRRDWRWGRLGQWPSAAVLLALAACMIGQAASSQPGKSPNDDDALEAARRAAMQSIQKSAASQPATTQPATTQPAKVMPARPLGDSKNGAADGKFPSTMPDQRGIAAETFKSGGSTPPSPGQTGPAGRTPRGPAGTGAGQRAGARAAGAAPGAGGAAMGDLPRLATGGPSSAPSEGEAASAPAQQTTMTFVVAPADPNSRSYRFDYVNTPWADVLADFARMSGLPFLNQPDPPISDSLTFHSPKTFTYSEAMDQLNELLLARPLNKYLIQREGNFLTIKRLPDLMREIPAEKMFDSFEAMDRAGLGEFEIVLVQCEVPAGWNPYEIIERYRPWFSDTYGTQVNGDRIELTGLVREHRRFKDVVSTITTMQEPPQFDPRPSRTVRLKHAKASDLQTLLRQVYPITAPTVPGRTGPGVDQTAETAKKIDIIADVRNNALLIKAPQRLLEEISDLAAKLDTGTGPKLPEMKVIKLQYAEPNALSTALKQIFAKEQQSLMRDPTLYIAPEQRAAMERDIFADPTTNSVILVGGAEGIAAAERTVREWDVPAENQVSEVVELEHAEAAAMAGQLTQMFPPVAKPGQPADRVTVRTASSLLVTASRKNLDRMREAIGHLDVAAEETQEHVVKLKAATPSLVAVIVQQSITATQQARVIGGGPRPAGQPGQPGQAVQAGPGAAASGARLIPDDSTGMLIVYCSAKDWKQIEPLIDRLDAQAASGEARLERVSLTKADADDVAGLLRQMYPSTPAQPGKAASGPFFYADGFNNAVQIYAGAELIEKVKPLIAALDIETDAELTIIRLAHARAEAVAPILQQAVGAKAGSGLAAAPPGQPGQPPQVARPGAVVSGQVRIVAEPITNALLVRAPEKELAQIKKLAADMDAEEETRTARVILEAQHRSADELASALRNMVGSGGGPRPAGAPGQPAAAAAASAGSRATTIVTSGRQIIIDGPREEVAKLIQLHEQLDVPYDQPFFRKYAVMDAEEDEKKLRAMLAMTPAASKSPAGGAPAAGGAPGAAPRVAPVSLSAPDAVSIYSDTYENTLLVGVKVESDFDVIERLLALVFADPRRIEGGPEAGMEGRSYFTIELKSRKAFDIAFDLEDLLNPGRKSGGISLSEGPSERTLLVQNCKPAQREQVEELVKMWDVPRRGQGKNIRIIDSKIPPAALAKLLERNWSHPEGAKLTIQGALDTSAVQLIDIHADEPDEEPVRPAVERREESGSGSGGSGSGSGGGGIHPCVLPLSLLRAAGAASMGQVAANQPLYIAHPKDCPLCRQHACALPSGLTNSLAQVIYTAFDDPLYDRLEGRDGRSAGSPEDDDDESAEHNHAVPPEGAGASKSPNEANDAKRSTGRREIAIGGANQPPAAERAPAERVLAQVMEQQGVTITVDPDTNKLILQGPEELLDELESLIDELLEGDTTPVIRVFPLKYADVTTAAQLLEQVFNQGQAALTKGKGKGAQPQMVPAQPQPQQGQPGQPGQPGGQPGQPQPGGRQGQPQMVVAQAPARIKVVPDVRTRSLMVISPPQDVPLIVDVLKKIDKRVPPAEGTLKIFQLVNLDAQQVAENLREIFSLPSARGGRGAGGRPGQPGQPPTPEQVQQQIIQMQGGQPGQPGQAIGATISSSDNLKISADVQTNCIIAQGAPDTLEMMESIIKDLEDKTNTTKPEMRRVELKHARASSVATIAKEVSAATAGPGGGGQGGRGGGRGGAVSVTADVRTNSVIVAGQTKDVERVEGIIRDLDVDSGGKTIRQFPVKGDPAMIATALKALFAEGGPGQQDIVITSDASTGTVMVKAASVQMEEIEGQLREMEQRVASTTELRTIKLSIADPESIATKLQEIFADRRTSRGGKANISIKGSKSNNMLYVSGADDEVFADIAAAAAGMDVAPTGMKVLSYTLEHASAIDINQKLTEMMVKAAQTGGLGNMKLDLVGVVPDPRTNSLIVTGGPMTHALIEDVLKQIDVMSPTPIARETKSYVLPGSADANVVAANINNLFASQTFQKTGIEPPSVTANLAANIVIVQANATQHEQILANIIEPIKSQVGQPLQDYQVALNFARADEVKATVEDFMTKWRTARGNKPQDAFTVTADPNSNMLLVNCSPETKVVFDKQLAELDKESVAAAGERSARTHTLRFANPGSVHQAITTAFTRAGTRLAEREQVAAAVDWNTSSVLVLANEKNHEKVEEIVKMMDVEGQAGQMVDHLYQVKNARATELANLLNNQVRNTRKAVQGQPFPIMIAGDDATNALVVTCTEKDYESVLKLIEQLDVKSADAGEREQRIYKLVYADPGSTSNAIRTVFQKIGGTPSARDQVMVADDWTTNSVIVSASRERHEEIKKIIDEMDKPGEAQRTERVIDIENTNPQDVATTLQQIFDAQNAGRRQRASATIRAVAGSAKIVCFANETEFKQIQNLVTMIDNVQGGRSVHTVTMPELVPAKSVAENINKLFGTAAGGGRDGVKAEYHEPTNTLLVFASDAEFEKVNKQVIEVVSQTPTVGALKFFKIPLKFAVADEVAKTLQEFFDKKSGINRGRSNLPPWMGGGSASQQMDNQVTITAETTGNMLLVYCTETTKELIDGIIADIDTDAPQGGRTMEMVALKYMDAAEMIGILTEYLKVSKRSSPDDGQRFIPWWMDGREEKKDDKAVLAGDLRLKAVESLNAVIVAGRPEGVEDAVKKIKELDIEREDDASAPQTIKLAHGNAGEIANTLNNVFNDPKRKEGAKSGAYSKPPTIVADTATNSVIVWAKANDLSQIRKMIDNIDSQMEGATGEVHILPVPAGRSVDDLARLVERQLNDAERNRQQAQKDYKPDLVSIGAEPWASALLVSGSKGKYEEARRLVEELVAMGPAGGTVRKVINMSGRLTPQEAKRIIDNMQGGSSSQGGRGSGGFNRGGRGDRGDRGGRGDGGGRRRDGGNRGPSGDATWTQQRRYEKSLGLPARRSAIVAGTIPGVLMNLTLAAATAQVSPHMQTMPTVAPPAELLAQADSDDDDAGQQDSTAQGGGARDSKARSAGRRAATTQGSTEKKATTQPARPVVGTIRPRAAATQPETGQPAGRQPAASAPAGMTAEQMIEAAAAQGMDLSQMTEAAQEAFSRKLSGAPITAVEAGDEGLFIEGSEEDVEVIEALLRMLDTSVPGKEIEYVALKNAQAKSLAETLKRVFEPLQQRGTRPVKPEDKVDIIADPNTNGVYIAATADKMAMALKLIEQNEQAASVTVRNVKTFQFRNRRVLEVGEVLSKIIDKYLTQRGLEKSVIQLEVDPQTNSISVIAGETDLKFVENIIKGLDAEPEPVDQEGRLSVGEADVMIIPLRVAKADALGTLLNEILKKAATGDTPMRDFIRRFNLLDEHGNRLQQVNLDRPVVIFGDKDSNSLIVASTKENCLIMKQVAGAFDVEPARAEVISQVVTLKFADATEVAEQVTKLLTDSQNLTARPGQSEKSGAPEGEAGALVYNAVVMADTRSNQLVVVGRPESVKVLTDLVASIDVKGLDVMPFQIVSLEFASATSLETALTALMKERAEALPTGKSENAKKAETVIIKGDPRSRSLIIAAKPARMEELRGLIRQLDKPATALVEDIRTITLKNCSAGDLATKLTELWKERAAQQEEGGKGLKLETPAIVADERSNSLIVAASKGDFDAIKAVVEKIEALELNPMAKIQIVTLKYASAPTLKAALTTLFDKRAEMRTVDGKSRPEDKVAIEVDDVSNSLLFAGSQENFDVLKQTTGALDVEMVAPGVVEYFVCDNVGAQRVKDTIDELFKEGVYRPGGARESEALKAREKVVVTIDTRANILIVSAAPENMEVIREIHKRMNSVTTPWDVAITRLIDIEHGDSVKISAQVKDYFDKLKEIRSEGEGGDKAAGGFGITIFADERSNRVVIGGTKDGIDGAVELVKRLDVPPGTPGQVMEVYRLTDASATRIGEMIKNVFEQRNKPREGDTGTKVASVPVTIEANTTTNSLLVNASREDHILIRDLVERLDRPSTVAEMTRVVPLEKAPAARVKEILEELYKGGTGGEGGGSGGQSSIAVVEDKRTNSVVVTAPPGELDNITKLVQRLDETEVKGQIEVAVFTIENEDAKKMAELLNAVISGKGGPEGSTEAAGDEKTVRDIASTLISFGDKDVRGREVLIRTMRENVQITYNERTNSIVAVAPPPALRLIEHLVRKLDRIQKRAVLVKVFPLTYADATKMVDLLNEMFAREEGSEDQRAFQEGREITVEGGSSSTAGVPTAASQAGPSLKGTFGRPKTTFVPDERTNSVIVAGWPEDIDVVADVIDQLDSLPINERENFVYSLNNATAEDVQSAMEAFFSAESQRLDALGDTVSPQRRMEQEVSVVAHPESNQLIVSVSPRYKDRVLTVMEQLDRPPPQVMIQVMIAEVSLDNRFEMGLEFALQELKFSETAVPGGGGVLQSSHFDVVGGTDLGAAGSGLGGFSFTITGEDFNFLVRALQADSRLEVIQRPMIMCQDNQQAQILIGQQVPIPQGTSSFAGQVNTAVNYQNVGVILRVEPHINPDGFVYMLVEPEISSVTDSTIQIAPGSFAPIINTRNASTSVAVKDGETVVIGGLITTTENEAESKVPVLGDIPGLGMLFRTTTRRKAKTELLIAMTPRVVRTVEDARRISIEARDISGLITPEMKQSPLMDGLQVKPETPFEVESIDLAPGWEEGAEPVRYEEPGQPPADEKPAAPKPRYGPQAPRYGPMVPSGEEIVARRTTDRATAGVRE